MYAQEEVSQDTTTKEIRNVREQVDQLQKQAPEDMSSRVDQLDKRLSQLEPSSEQSESLQEREASDQIDKQLEGLREDIQELEQDVRREERQKWYLDARVTTADPVTFVRTMQQFNNVLDANELVVAYLYSLPPEKVDVIEKDGARRRTDRWYTVDTHGVSLVSVAKKRLYRNANVAFIAVNLDDGQLDRLRERYDIDPNTQDIVMLFRDGVPYTKQRLQGSFDTYELEQFVDRYFRDIAQQKAEEIKERRKERQQKTRVRYVYDNYDRPRFNIGFGYGPYHDYHHYGYPYRHYSSGYGYPHFGWQFGW